jgi:hypothetical protein
MEIKDIQKRVFVFIDTNLLWNDDKNKKNFDIFSTFFLNQMLLLRDFISQEIKNTEMRIVIPKTTICERYKQKYDYILTDIGNVLLSLKNLKRIEQFDNVDVILELESIQKGLYTTIKSNGDEFLKNNKIHSTQECPNEYFEKIIKKAYNKEKPFDNKKADGFKDALIWYSMIDYLKNEPIKKEDLIFFFTNNIRDFKSKITLDEFKTLVQNDIHIIDIDKSEQIYHTDYKEFLKDILKDAQKTKISNIRIEYCEFDNSVIIEKIWADPFPNNLASLIDITQKPLRTIDCKNLLKTLIIDLLKNFDFDVDLQKITYKYIKIPNIEEILVFLEFHEKGYFYDINRIEIRFEDDYTIEPDFENMIIPEECISFQREHNFEYFKIDPIYDESIVKMISKQINRKIHPEMLDYDVLG